MLASLTCWFKELFFLFVCLRILDNSDQTVKALFCQTGLVLDLGRWYWCHQRSEPFWGNCPWKKFKEIGYCSHSTGVSDCFLLSIVQCPRASSLWHWVTRGAKPDNEWMRSWRMAHSRQNLWCYSQPDLYPKEVKVLIEASPPHLPESIFCRNKRTNW